LNVLLAGKQYGTQMRPKLLARGISIARIGRVASSLDLTGFKLRHLVLLLLLAPSLLLVAQDTSARLSGTVSDSTGAVVSGAKLILINPATKAELAHAVSDDHGNYTALQLPPGK